eukprot:gnl/MRDRNA2_/MRDRNA2_70132_c0_seq1.p1 gnl/MRDRNA2_/MRDRNA2_70132_c0~~gnl/MRDRNA2_/MRDRNA2_70132_c0_seq1.p1  ORF type:complete len:142 (+),score=16.10 gnl/MRDRNA2_/MRDRNA2_70132_c0_seq1:73-498(+)
MACNNEPLPPETKQDLVKTKENSTIRNWWPWSSLMKLVDRKVESGLELARSPLDYGRAVGHGIGDSLVLGSLVIGMVILPLNIWWHHHLAVRRMLLRMGKIDSDQFVHGGKKWIWACGWSICGGSLAFFAGRVSTQSSQQK